MPKTKKEKKVEQELSQELSQEQEVEQKSVVQKPEKVQSDKVLNPKTNRLVKIGGKAHKNMMKGEEKKK